MKKVRIIPRLDIKGPHLVKGIHLEGLRVLGDPENFAKFYYESGADELLLMDVVASLYGRNNLSEIIERTASNVFIPITVGGGIRSIEDIKKILRCGADKVAINTKAINNPEFIKEASDRFGSSTIAVTIEVINYESEYLCFTDNGREYTGIRADEWAIKVAELGAGEIILTSVDNEGSGKGFDITLIDRISKLVDVPVIVHGGAGKKEHFSELFHNCDIHACSAASIFHYNAINSFTKSSKYKNIGNMDFVISGVKKNGIHEISIKDLKMHLKNNNIPVR